jgi:hypothetical protein
MNRTPPRDDQDTLFLRGAYVGIVHGVLDMISSNEVRAACPPAGSSTGQSLRVTVAYMASHPAELHEEVSRLTPRTLHGAWPCQAAPAQVSR